jgi:hypothetical protein
MFNENYGWIAEVDVTAIQTPLSVFLIPLVILRINHLNMLSSV